MRRVWRNLKRRKRKRSRHDPRSLYLLRICGLDGFGDFVALLGCSALSAIYGTYACSCSVLSAGELDGYQLLVRSSYKYFNYKESNTLNILHKLNVRQSVPKLWIGHVEAKPPTDM